MRGDRPEHARGGIGARGKRPLLLVAMILAAALAVGRRERADLPIVYELGGATMGTTYSVTLVAPPLREGRLRSLEDSVAGRLGSVDRAMSTYDPTSELSLFNAHIDTEPFAVSAAMLEVFLVAQTVSAASGGALDVTVEPLVEAWGFGRGGHFAVPEEERIEELRSHVGFRKITVDSVASSLVKLDPEVVADLSAVAKGYGVDRVADLLLDLGFTDFLVEVGGELRSSGVKADDEPWVVGVEAPVPETLSLYATMQLADESVATSGDYRNFWDAGDRRYSHIIDPHTGRPLAYVGSAVTVIHKRAALADAWATAMSVLGPETGLAVADDLGLEVIFVRRGEFGLLETRSSVAAGRTIGVFEGS